ncbi:hypothetical protein MYXO_02882 [Myxococcaceae bacterium]|jgi:hypothetical protein|nr:hypothetical protein MYXO_02882 [Myxococcaceae bacterium]
MRIWRRTVMAALAATLLLGSGSARATVVTGQPARDAFEANVLSSGFTKITFDGFSPNTKITTQIAGLSFRTIRDPNGNPLGGTVGVNMSPFTGRIGTIVGTPCSGCSDDGRYAYEIVFSDAQSAAGIQRLWNSSTVTRFFNSSGLLLGEYQGSTYVGWLGDPNDATTHVKRIEIDGVVLGGSRQVGYSDDLIYGTIPEPSTAALVALGLTGLAARRRR